MTQEELEHAAQLYEEAAAELERALGHCGVAAEQATQHTRKAQLPGD